MAEDKMFDDLENMLGGGGTAIAGSKSSAKPGTNLNKRGSNSRIVPVNDIDDLDDMYNFESKRVVPAKTAKVTTSQMARQNEKLPPLASRVEA